MLFWIIAIALGIALSPYIFELIGLVILAPFYILNLLLDGYCKVFNVPNHKERKKLGAK